MKKSAHLALGVLAGLSLGCTITALARPKTAQDPVKSKPDSYTVFLENDKMRVFEYRLKPGETEPLHSHPCGVFYYFFTDAKFKAKDGKIIENAKAGDHGWREPVTHQAQNVGENEIRALIVEPRPCSY